MIQPNFEKVNVIDVDGFAVGVAVGLVYDRKNEGHSLVKAAKDLAASPDWFTTVKAAGLLPPEE